MDKQNQMKQQITWLRVLTCGSILFVIYAAVIALLNFFIGFAFTAVVGVVLGLTLFPFLGEKFLGEDWSIAAAWVGIVFGFVLAATNALSFITYTLLPEKNVARDVDVQYAFVYEKPVLFFSDGIIRADFSGSVSEQGFTYAKTGGRGRAWASETVVAPLVGDSWDKGDSVTVWVVCSDSWEREREVSDVSTCTQEWSKPYRSGYVISATELVEAKDAIKDAEQRYGIRSREDAKIIHWSDDPLKYAKTNAQGTLAVFVFFELIWFIILIVKRKDFTLGRSV